MAERAGLGVATLAAIQRDQRRRPHPHTISALAAALDLASDDRTRFSDVAARPVASPPAVSVSRKWRPIPASTTQLIGRELDLQVVLGLLRNQQAGPRLLTLLGPGGVGKTRLALAVAHAAQADYVDGVAFVDLAPLTEHRMVPATIAWVLRLNESTGRSARDLLIDCLRRRHQLGVLDNFEHLLGAAPLLGSLLEVCPKVIVLVTGRVALRLRIERRVSVAPLETPPPSVHGVEAIRASPAVGLFVDRAQAAAAGFALTDSNALAVTSHGQIVLRY